MPRSKRKKKAKIPPKTKPAQPVDLTDDFKIKKTRIKVIGIGDGGSQIVAELAKNLKRVEFWVANTDWQRRRRFPPGVKVFRFGEKYTRGQGAGREAEIGRLAGLAEKERIAKILKGTDLCFLVSCLGGGTSSGASPVFARLAQKTGALVFGIFTLPFRFEGGKKMELAKEALERARPSLNAQMILPNEKIFQTLDKNLAFEEGLSILNKVLAQALEGLVGLIFQPGLINIDFADLRTTLQGRGKLAYLLQAEFSRGSKLEEVKKKIFQNPFLLHKFTQSRQVIFNVASDQNLSLAEVAQIAEQVFGQAHPDAKIIFGVSFDQNLKNKIRVVLLAVSAWERNSRFNKRAAKILRKTKLGRKKKTILPQAQESKAESKVRRNAIQVREGVKAEEEQIAAREKAWETPAVLRRGALSSLNCD